MNPAEINPEILHLIGYKAKKEIRHYEDLFKNPENHYMDKDEYTFEQAQNLCYECVKYQLPNYEIDYRTRSYRKISK